MATPSVRMLLGKNGSSSPLRHLLRGSSLFNASSNTTSVNIQKISDLKTRTEPATQCLLGVPSSGDVDDAVDIGLNNLGLHLGWRFCGFEEMGRVEARHRRVVSEEEEDDDDDDELEEDIDMDFSGEGESDFDDDDDEDEEEEEEDEDDYHTENIRKRK